MASLSELVEPKKPFEASTNNEGHKGKFLTNPLSDDPTVTYYARLSLVHPTATKTLTPANNEKLIVAGNVCKIIGLQN